MTDYAKISKEYAHSLSLLSDEELLQRYHQETKHSGWGSSRGIYLGCLRNEMQKRWDISAILSERGGLSLHSSNRCYLEGRKLIKICLN